MLNPPPLNLLRHPRRAGLPGGGGLPGVLWALLLGTAVGTVLALWQGHMQRQAQAERAHLQAPLQQQEQQLAQQRQAQADARLQARLRERLEGWRSLRRQVMDLQARLAQEAQASGLRLQRWQADGHKLILQLSLPQAEHLPGRGAGLSEALSQPWTLQAMSGQSGAPGVEAVIEASWPVQQPARGKP